MKKIIFLLCVLAGGGAVASGQTAGSTPSPEQATRRVIPPPRKGIFDTQRKSTSSSIDSTQGALVVNRNPAYRKPTKEDLQLVAPDRAEIQKYADFLKHSRTGLVRLLSDEGCQENANLVVARDFCIKYKNLFGGSAFSFRTKNYTLGRFSDVVYKDGTLYATGKMTLGFLVDLGKDVSLDAVSAETAGVGYVFGFRPPENLPQIEAALESFRKGAAANGYEYRRFFALRENHTYVLRSVAYRKREQRERNQIIYDDLGNDDRRDVIVAFQVVKFADAEKSSVVLLWKELQRKNTAKIALE